MLLLVNQYLLTNQNWAFSWKGDVKCCRCICFVRSDLGAGCGLVQCVCVMCFWCVLACLQSQQSRTRDIFCPLLRNFWARLICVTSCGGGHKSELEETTTCLCVCVCGAVLYHRFWLACLWLLAACLQGLGWAGFETASVVCVLH